MNADNPEKSVIVFWDPGEKIYKISPATLPVRMGGGVIFHNVTDATVNVQFQNGSPFGGGAIQIKAGQTSGPLQVTEAKGPYAYEAIMDISPHVVAAQGSKPIIIILN
jgi:hypothetical protein